MQFGKKKLRENSAEFELWMTKHAPDCSINHTGSSCVMEMKAAEKIWKRPSTYKLRYTEVVSDGDSKTIQHLNSLQIYGPQTTIVKNECVNHVEKR